MARNRFTLLTGKRCLIAITFIIALSSISKGQNEYYIWAGVKASYELFPKVDISFNPEIRINTSAKERETLFEASLSYEPFKFIGADINYRYSAENIEGAVSNYHRFAFDLQPKAEFGRFSGGLRVRYTNYSDLVGENPEFQRYWRIRGEIEHDIRKSKLTPYLSGELFHNIEDSLIDKVRYIAGAKYKFNKMHSIDGYLLYQDYPGKSKNRIIFGSTYRIKL